MATEPSNGNQAVLPNAQKRRREPAYLDAAELGQVLSHAPVGAYGIERACGVPIHIDVDVDGVRVVESAVWDLHEEHATPEAFAAEAVRALDLQQRCHRPIARQVREQVHSFTRSLPSWLRDGDTAPCGECLAMLEIEVRSRWLYYKDRVEWNILCPLNSPEAFARQTIADMQLPQEFEAAIAFTMHEQIANHRQLIFGRGGERLVNRSIVQLVIPPTAAGSGVVVAKTEGAAQPGSAETAARPTHGPEDAPKPTTRSSGSSSSTSKRVRVMPPLAPGVEAYDVQDKKRFGPRLSLLSAVEQMEHNTESWKIHRPETGGAEGLGRPRQPVPTMQLQQQGAPGAGPGAGGVWPPYVGDVAAAAAAGGLAAAEGRKSPPVIEGGGGAKQA